MWYIMFVISTQNPDTIHITTTDDPISDFEKYKKQISGDIKATGYSLYIYEKPTLHSVVTSKKHIENILRSYDLYGACGDHDYRRKGIFNEVLGACQRVY